ncbi:MAG: hypothetical protein CMF51_02280 [Legionellales bacterium]|nr:hypothetical protein [Legionellales bacterium]
MMYTLFGLSSRIFEAGVQKTLQNLREETTFLKPCDESRWPVNTSGFQVTVVPPPHLLSAQTGFPGGHPSRCAPHPPPRHPGLITAPPIHLWEFPAWRPTCWAGGYRALWA